MKDDILIISVSDLASYFGVKHWKIHELRGKRVVVVNSKKHKVIGSFQMISNPVTLDPHCPIGTLIKEKE